MLRYDDCFRQDIWFAWYPVRTGALGSGRLVWLRTVWRERAISGRYKGFVIYQLTK